MHMGSDVLYIVLRRARLRKFMCDESMRILQILQTYVRVNVGRRCIWRHALQGKHAARPCPHILCAFAFK